MTSFVRHPEVVYTDLEDGAVLLHEETKFFYSLDQVGAAVWRLLDTSGTVESLIRRLQTEYDVTAEIALGSVADFIRELEREQLVTLRGEPTDGSAGYSGGPMPDALPAAKKKPFVKPELLKHDEPLHAVVMNPFDPQLPLAE